MPAQIKQSTINEVGIKEFHKEVEALRQAKLDHRFTQNTPVPVVHPLLDQAIRRVPAALVSDNPPVHDGPDDFVIDYEIIDDLPKPDEKKQHLRGVFLTEETRIGNNILPPGKRRITNLRIIEIEDKISRDRGDTNLSQEDKDFMADVQKKKDQLDKLHRFGAQVESEIEDLTEENIDSWVMPSFPEFN